jgi:16S rRNA (guanine966-N2)-methyltransferase
MRVIAGEARSRALKAPKGTGTRPTSDKVKGAIFSMLESMIMSRVGAHEDLWQGYRILDLYAGSGALGIEALSRGAEWADFVDVDSAACRTVQANLAFTALEGRGRVHCMNVQRLLAPVSGSWLKGPYDVVFMDPPYKEPGIEEFLERLAESELFKPEGVLVVEHSRRVSLSADYGKIRLVKTRRHGDTNVSIYTKE